MNEWMMGCYEKRILGGGLVNTQWETHDIPI